MNAGSIIYVVQRKDEPDPETPYCQCVRDETQNPYYCIVTDVKSGLRFNIDPLHDLVFETEKEAFDWYESFFNKRLHLLRRNIDNLLEQFNNIKINYYKNSCPYKVGDKIFIYGSDIISEQTICEIKFIPRSIYSYDIKLDNGEVIDAEDSYMFFGKNKIEVIDKVVNYHKQQEDLILRELKDIREKMKSVKKM